MCPQCRAFITTSDHICPYCDAPVAARAVDRRAPGEILGGIIPHARFTTMMILLINTGLYLAMAVYSMRAAHGASAMDLDARTLFDFGAKYREAILAGQWWRLVTAGFLHGGLMHIGMNSWVLFDLGAQVEELYGTSRLIVFYFVSTILGFLASTFWSPALSVGASAGLFGLIGVMIALGLREKSVLGSQVRGLYIRWAVYGFVFGLLPFFAVDNAAHLGGLAGGFICAYVAGTPSLRTGWQEGFWRAASIACLAITAIAFVQMFLALSSGGN